VRAASRSYICSRSCGHSFLRWREGLSCRAPTCAQECFTAATGVGTEPARTAPPPPPDPSTSPPCLSPSLSSLTHSTFSHRCAFSPSRYDLDSTTWSPAGRVFQIEYAGKAVDNSGYVRHAHTRTYTQTHTQTHRHARAHTDTHRHTRARTHTHTHTHTHTYTHTHKCARPRRTLKHSHRRCHRRHVIQNGDCAAGEGRCGVCG
jgi:hypothetical protein